MSLFWLFLIQTVWMVKQEDFKTCAQSGFCKRQRAFAHLRNSAQALPVYALQEATLETFPDAGILTAQLMETTSQIDFTLVITTLSDSIRLQIHETKAAVPAYSQMHSYSIHSPLAVAYEKITLNNTIQLNFKHNTLKIEKNPFRLELSRNQVPIVRWNERNYFYYEHYRIKEEPVESNTSKEASEDVLKELTSDLWEETFNGKTDSKPRGPSSIGFDVSFPGALHVYGIPEHASDFSLKTTRGTKADYSEPFRLYNLDVFEYITDSPMALYGSIPFMQSHKSTGSGGIFWVNAAEMWIDIEKSSSSSSSSSFTFSNLFSRKGKQEPTTSTHWIAESGVVDVFLFVGEKPSDVVKSFTQLTGPPALPQLFALGYHQCRWNFIDEADVQNVDAKSDEYAIPYDVLWLDIEHTDGKKYFTWDLVKFPNPEKMQNDLASRGRKMVTIIDPHIKVDEGYDVWKDAKDKDLFVHSSSSSSFEGWCWPGNSQWLDYLNPASREFWANKFSNYPHSTLNLYYWNDMNEPSVFTGPEITMPKDNLHFEGWEHRDVHNAYGMLQHRSTYEGHLKKTGNDRPFILSRAFFAGTQRYGAIWTGDNVASWDHLAASVPMLLSISISGISFCGADVGGFFGNPEPELLVRWYQVGAFQPFFRSHQHIDTKRREPWLFGEPFTSYIREAVRTRYMLLPYLYTLFYEASSTGLPVMRPMVMEFPQDEESFGIGDQFMLGSALLIKPVIQKDTSSLKTYLPKSSIWYNYMTLQAVGSGHVSMKTPLDRIPVFLKGGSIVPRRQRIRRSASLMTKDPITLLIALDEKETAKGEIYLDDGKSFNYQKGDYLTALFQYEKHSLVSKPIKNTPETVELFGQRVERIIITGLKKITKAVRVESKSLDFVWSDAGQGLHCITIKDPAVIIGNEWKLEIVY